ncbi:YdcF family protein [Rhodoblastus acidophilus]|uniref:YdcF family protein n=1 Tax=Candidatus Rhodoblastus alkanivorans TaxID=2954117 RepID=A0ABS9Z601_9HYPH|nr:YdcF family protein [Candidatus Rhodoblastus alkanivorans]MCI4680276.1 YdcF family protein [Candidatus Rhodoblastus alkanivorans]MCI4683095.1 YdcF family protein [Candidatus Rhodoblastus alkanivorans]MDI4640406.1 YdcF family protein [Rhodoblastus acidophilus]
MFFVASKIFWLLASPLHLLLILLLAGLILAPRWRPGRMLALAAAIVLALIVFSPASALLIRPLEDRFPERSAVMTPPKGIIVLGGAVDEGLTLARNQVALNEAAERMTEGAALARLYPQAMLVFSGGSSALIDNSAKEANVARRLWRELGVPESQMRFEDRSRNTFENAAFTKRLVNPQKGEKWLLVTSAYHMPRAMGVFRAQGMDPEAFPVDYRTFGNARDNRPPGDGARAVVIFETAAREWVGLLVYRLTGKTNALFPAP